jgi:hypothetical protein
VDSQLSQEGAGKASAGVNDDVESESEPEASTGSLDPLDPELNFRHYHPSTWRLWAAWMERRMLLRGLVDPSWPLLDPLWRCPVPPKCGFSSPIHSRSPRTT